MWADDFLALRLMPISPAQPADSLGFCRKNLTAIACEFEVSRNRRKSPFHGIFHGVFAHVHPIFITHRNLRRDSNPSPSAIRSLLQIIAAKDTPHLLLRTRVDYPSFEATRDSTY